MAVFQKEKKIIQTENFFTIPDNCWIVNASAGITVHYGKFMFKIHDQKLIFRGDWAREVGRKQKSKASVLYINLKRMSKMIGHPLFLPAFTLLLYVFSNLPRKSSQVSIFNFVAWKNSGQDMFRKVSLEIMREKIRDFYDPALNFISPKNV